MGIRELFRLPSKPSKALIAWMREPGEQERLLRLTLEETRRARPHEISQEDWVPGAEEKFFKSIENSIREGDQFVVAIVDSAVAASREYKIAGPGASLDRYISSLTVAVQTRLTLSDLSIKTLSFGPGVNLRINNCNIRFLQIYGKSEIRLSRSNVGTLSMGSDAASHYEMEGGSLLNVECPPPGPNNPFTGTVSFTKDVFFPRKRNTYILSGPQPYRSMRHHLRSLENAQMANLIHSAELAVEREDDSWTNRFFSYLYEGMSDFGSSALRPILWLLLFYALSVCAIFYSDGAEVPPLSDLVGWQRALIDPAWGEYWRAFYLALQPVVNPIGIFGPKSLLVPRYPLLAVWLSVHGFFGLILLALVIFAIRRRFKIQA